MPSGKSSVRKSYVFEIRFSQYGSDLLEFIFEIGFGIVIIIVRTGSEAYQKLRCFLEQMTGFQCVHVEKDFSSSRSTMSAVGICTKFGLLVVKNA